MDKKEAFGREQNAEYSVAKIWGMLSSNWWIVACAAIAFASMATVYTLLVSDVYRTGSLVAVNGKYGKQALAMLRSRDFLERFISDEDIFHLVFSERRSKAKDHWINAGGSMPDQRVAAGVLAKQLISKESRDRSGLHFIGMESSDPRAAADLINKLIIYLNEAVTGEVLDKALVKRDYYEKKVFEHDSLLIVRLTGLGSMQPDLSGVKGNGRSADSQIIDYLQRQSILSGSLKERGNLVAKKVVSDEVVLRADIDADEFALKIYEKARAPETSIRPRKGVIIVLGLITGTFTGLFIVFMKEVARRRG